MADKNWHAGGTILIPVRAVMCLACAAAPARAFALSGNFAEPGYVGKLDPGLIWEALIVGVVACSLAVAVALWIHAAVCRGRRMQLRRNAFVSSALNNLNQGVVMTVARQRLI